MRETDQDYCALALRDYEQKYLHGHQDSPIEAELLETGESFYVVLLGACEVLAIYEIDEHSKTIRSTGSIPEALRER